MTLVPADGPHPEKRAPGALEIERTFLLDSMPSLPAGARVLRIEQGYLPERPGRRRDPLAEGRLRRTVHPDGAVVCTHTLKHGKGLVRREVERTIPADEFERRWPRTAGRRLTKTRHCVPEGDLLWEIDRYDGLDLVLADVELPTPETRVTLPAWLAPHVIRDVTDEPEYRNYRIALRISAAS